MIIASHMESPKAKGEDQTEGTPAGLDSQHNYPKPVPVQFNVLFPEGLRVRMFNVNILLDYSN